MTCYTSEGLTTPFNNIPTKEFVEALNDYCRDYYRHYDGYPVEFEYEGKLYPYEHFIAYVEDDVSVWQKIEGLEK